mmetsp:Transcript_24962/g.41414  ORF Transcript_24962/g.41414 Transcript_24962/m.41414 type:complete len:218 (+) Transcript_24962:837-1490(+)
MLNDTMIFNQSTLGVMPGWRNVGRHGSVKASLVLARSCVPGGLLLGRQTLVHGRCILGQLTKGHARVFATKLFPHGILVEQVGTQVSFGSIRIAHRLPTPSSGNRVACKGHDGIPLDVISRRRNVVGKFVEVPNLVGFRTSDPRFFFFGGETGVHARCVLGELTKCHAGALRFEGFAHGVLVQQVGRHVALGGARVAGCFLHHFDLQCNLFSCILLN